MSQAQYQATRDSKTRNAWLLSFKHSCSGDINCQPMIDLPTIVTLTQLTACLPIH